MPKLLAARPPTDGSEEHQVRRLARSAHAPADWVVHAKMIVASWDGLRTNAIAAALGCHPQTVRERFSAFNERGLDGLGMKPGSGRKPRLSEAERSAVIALVASPPPGRLITYPDGTLAPAGITGETSPSGRSMRWRPRPRRRASRLDAARSAGSYARKGSVGAARIPGGRPPRRGPRISPQKDRGRRLLHRSAGRLDDPLPR